MSRVLGLLQPVGADVVNLPGAQERHGERSGGLTVQAGSRSYPTTSLMPRTTSTGYVASSLAAASMTPAASISTVSILRADSSQWASAIGSLTRTSLLPIVPVK